MAFSSYLHHDPDYSSLPETVDEELLLSRVQALRNGDQSVIGPIVTSLMRLVMSIVRNMRSSNDELIGVALLTLQESVLEAQIRLNDDNIIPYVLSNVRYRLIDCLTEAKYAGMTARTLRDRRLKGKSIPQLLAEMGDEFVSMPDNTAADLREELESMARSQRQRAVIELKSQCYSCAEIAAQLKVSTPTIGRELLDLRERYELRCI